MFFLEQDVAGRYLEIVVWARRAAVARERSLDVKPLKRESDSAALWLTNDVHTLLVVRVPVRIVGRRQVTGLLRVHSTARLNIEHDTNIWKCCE